MDDLNIKVAIGNRVYPLTIDRAEEEDVRKAADLINDRIKDYEQQYSVKDKQDLIAMCALQFANELLEYRSAKVVADESVVEDLEKLSQTIAGQL